MAITLSKEKLNTRERVDLVKNIKDKANLFANKYQLKIHLSGLPYIRTVTTEKIKAEMVMFKCLERGLSFKTEGEGVGGNTITLRPALIITKEEMDKALDILDESIGEVERGIVY